MTELQDRDPIPVPWFLTSDLDISETVWHCRPCEIWWVTDTRSGPHCWNCGQKGVVAYSRYTGWVG